MSNVIYPRQFHPSAPRIHMHDGEFKTTAQGIRYYDLTWRHEIEDTLIEFALVIAETVKFERYWDKSIISDYALRLQDIMERTHEKD